MSNSGRFTIRVYGILIDADRILLSYENIFGSPILKFPGGGLEYGEGPLDCLRREFEEEAQLQVEPQSHFYTTEDFVPSRWGHQLQVLSLYYRVGCRDLSPLATGQKIGAHQIPAPGDQILFWRALSALNPAHFELPIDRKVAKLLAQKKSS